MVWLTGGALALCGIMVVTLLAVVLVGGSKTFWPQPIYSVVAADDDGVMRPAFLAMVVRDEAYEPSPKERAEIDAAKAKDALPVGAINSEGKPVRRMYRAGNKDFSGAPFVWRSLWRVKSQTVAENATLLEREDWGVWIGIPTAVVREQRIPLAGTAASVVATEGAGDGRIERKVEGTDGKQVVIERTFWDSTPAAVMAKFNDQQRSAAAVAERIHAIKDIEMGSINRRIDAERLRVTGAEIELARAVQSGGSGQLLPASLGWIKTAVSLAAGVLSVACLVFLVTRLRAVKPIEQGFLPPPQPARLTFNAALLTFGCMGLLFCLLEGPWHGSHMTVQKLEGIKQQAQASVDALNAQYQTVQKEVAELEAQDAQWRVVVTDPATNRFAPQRPTDPETPLRMSQVVRAVQPNALSLTDKLGLYFARWWEFVSAQPRDANTAGGIFPVIVGTVTLTLLLSVVVVPLGVIAALYLREYARQGPLTSMLRIAINNLAGVPSIVYGVFGLGFFCYTLGSFVDTGSGVDPASNWSLGPVSGRAVAMWWIGGLALAVVVIGAVLMGMLAKPAPGKREGARERWMARCAFTIWISAAIGAVALLAGTPYFHGFFEAKSLSGGGPTMAAKGMLWSAVTLALLTLPLVIVATEEAIAAVPRTVREASLGCGATKWQTIQRVVLPRAMPGIMTGAILAMARGAGEVAPLMLVGAVKLAPALPLDGDAPFLHLDRPFMHLGFHVYDVGFQSPDSEAARPLVWCTTLLLIVVVVSLNATAIRVRTGLRKKFLGEAF